MSILFEANETLARLASNFNKWKKKHSVFAAMLKTYFAHDQKLPRLRFLSIVHIETRGLF